MEAARIALAHLLANWRRGYSNADICIVFDGRDQDKPHTSPTRISGIDCFFTKTGEEADDRIIHIVRSAKNPRDIIVITEDNAIRNSCCAHGAEVKPARFLLPRGKRKDKSPSGTDKLTRTKNLSRITEYYKDYLRGKGAV